MDTEDVEVAQLSAGLASITARLVAHHDAMSVLGAVTDAGVSVLGADAAGILVIDPRGGITSLGGTDESARWVELAHASIEQGPCVEAITTASSVAVADVAMEYSRWPQFSARAVDAGFRSVYAFALRLDHRAVGGLNVFYTRPRHLSGQEHHIGQTLADFAVLGLTQERDERRIERLTEHTLTTVNDRAHLTQAVGFVVGALRLDPDTARILILAHSRRTQQSVRQLARELTEGVLDPHHLHPVPPQV